MGTKYAQKNTQKHDVFIRIHTGQRVVLRVSDVDGRVAPIIETASRPHIDERVVNVIHRH